MSSVSLATLLESLHKGVEEELMRARHSLGHPTDKGDASEAVWIELFETYLPSRYAVSKGHVVDSTGAFSHQIDVVIYDRQYSPLVFSFKGLLYMPAESVYAVFETKQEATADTVGYAQRKAASVRALVRTSMPVPTVDGVRAPKSPAPILAGLLTLSCAWKPPLGETMLGHLRADQAGGALDLGCIADAGYFLRRSDGDYEQIESIRSATRFFVRVDRAFAGGRHGPNARHPRVRFAHHLGTGKHGA